MSRKSKIPIYLKNAIDRYNENNKEKVKYNQYKSRAKTFVTKLADKIEDLQDLKKMIDAKIEELEKNEK
ncbi:MAG: hypothetical protein ACTTKD_09400 [Peptoanaerobacter stomatis]|uniref:hypothetical protein n=1 Tax=Peptoanaerobacter stomatis TaxID=796937 RepID=UPI003F9F4BD7